MSLNTQIPLSVEPPKINTPFEGLSQILAVRNAQQEGRLNEARLNDIQQQAAERKQIAAKAEKGQQVSDLVATATQQAMVPDPESGIYKIDRAKATQALTQAGAAQVIPELQKQWDAMDASANTLAQAHRTALAHLGYALSRAGTDPGLASAILAQGVANGQVRPEEAKRFGEMIQQDPASIGKVSDLMMASDQAVHEKYTAEQGLGKPKTKAELAILAAQGDKTASAALGFMDPPPPAPRQTPEQEYNNPATTPERKAELLKNRQTFSGAGRDPNTTPDSTSDVKDVVQGMIDGQLPPLLPGRATKEFIALQAEAKRRGFNLAEAATDWTATQKHIATMNGAQQLRLNQAINQLPELLDSIDILAGQWKGGRFPPLNRANLVAAKNGVFGQDVASVASQLAAQIADVTADLGNVYMGGNSPTDQALDLAAKALGADWSEKVLKDMVALARKNVQTRQRSINNTGVQGASDDNPYARPSAPSPLPPADPLGLFGK